MNQGFVTVQMAKGNNVNRYQDYSYPWLIPWATGRYYTLPFVVSTATAAPSADTLYAAPIYVPNVSGVTVTSLGVEVTTAGAAGSLGRIGVYEYTPSGLVGNLLVDSGSFATDGLGHKSGTVSKALVQGWYITVYGSTGGSLRWHNGMAQVWCRGAYNPADASSLGNWNARSVPGTGAVSYIVNNGFPTKLPNDPDHCFTAQQGGTNALRALVGI